MSTVQQHGLRVLTMPADGPVIGDEAAAVDVLGEAFGEQAEVVVVPVERLAPEFFRLRTGVAGAITQKFANYRIRLVVLGDVAGEGPVEDWVREANRGRELWFVADAGELDRRLAGSA